MTRARTRWKAAIIVTVLLWVAVLAIPAISLLMPNQYSGVTPPAGFILSSVLGMIAPSIAVAAVVMLVVLVVAAVLRRPVPSPPLPEESDDGIVIEGGLVARGWDQRR